MDGDGYGDPANPVCLFPQWDCDDTDPTISPGAEEICDNGIDDDCDGLIDYSDPDCPCIDIDGDGYGDPANPACLFPQWDCDDTDPDVYPGAIEICENGIDDDCDGLVDELEDCCKDMDGDGYGDPANPACLFSQWDCDDTDPDVYPGAEEICDNGIDDDCDGLVDANDPDCGQKFTLEMDASYAAGTLSMNFTIGRTSSWPTTWETYLILISPTVQVIPLWDIPLPAIHPPIDIPISFPFPSVGWIGLYSNLFALSSAQVVDLEWVDTGLPGQ